MVSTALYTILSDPGPAAQEFRHANSHLLRNSPSYRTAALRLVCAEEQRMTRFWPPHLRVVARAVHRSAREVASTRDWTQGRATFVDFAACLRWLAVATIQRTSAKMDVAKHTYTEPPE
jgi:hypothetical protein